MLLYATISIYAKSKIVSLKVYLASPGFLLNFK